MNIFGLFERRVSDALARLIDAGKIPQNLDLGRVVVEPPRDSSHGDLATNAAMVLAKEARTNPRSLAELIADDLRQDPRVATAEVAGPGFINLTLQERVFHDVLRAILMDGEGFGRSGQGAGAPVNVEYVSANPTGPMHVGHCRGAVFGDALAGLLDFAGYKVTREYYINDAGAQVDVLARSAYLRYKEALGHEVGEIPEGLYPGDYLKPVGEKLAAEFGDRHADAPESEWLDLFRRTTVAAMLDLIKADLALLGIHHDLFASEAQVQAS